jgi:hypothetical protein
MRWIGKNMKRLKRTHKNLMTLEAGFVWCLRKGIEYNDVKFIDEYFLTEDFDSSEGSEYDNLSKDLRMYRHNDSYVPITITDEEYELCVNEFGSEN